jgi:hypothetical protein
MPAELRTCWAILSFSAPSRNTSGNIALPSHCGTDPWPEVRLCRPSVVNELVASHDGELDLARSELGGARVDIVLRAA